jgi:hypothetical protein
LEQKSDQVGNQVGDEVRDLVGDIAGDKDRISNQVGNQVGNQVRKVLKSCLQPQKKKDILENILNISNQTKNFKNHIKPLIELQWLTYTQPTTIKSSKQAYITTDKGKLLLKILKEEADGH